MSKSLKEVTFGCSFLIVHLHAYLKPPISEFIGRCRTQLGRCGVVLFCVLSVFTFFVSHIYVRNIRVYVIPIYVMDAELRLDAGEKRDDDL